MKRFVFFLTLCLSIINTWGQTYQPLPVPYKNQPGSTGCGYYCLAMVECYYSGETPTDSYANGIASYFYPGHTATNATSCSRTDIGSHGTNQGFNVQYGLTFTANNYMARIKNAIDSGYPAICLVKANNHWTTGGNHWVVITGYDNDNVYANDPITSHGQNYCVSWSNFQTGLRTVANEYDGYYRIAIVRPRRHVNVAPISPIAQNSNFTISWNSSGSSVSSIEYRLQVSKNVSNWNRRDGFTQSTSTSSTTPININTSSSTSYTANLSTGIYYASVKGYARANGCAQSTLYSNPVKFYVYRSTLSPTNQWNYQSGNIGSDGYDLYRVYLQQNNSYDFLTGCGAGSSTYSTRIAEFNQQTQQS